MEKYKLIRLEARSSWPYYYWHYLYEGRVMYIVSGDLNQEARGFVIHDDGCGVYLNLMHEDGNTRKVTGFQTIQELDILLQEHFLKICGVTE